MKTPGKIAYLSATNDEFTTAGQDAGLYSIVVGTGTATSVVTVYSGTTTGGEVKAVIDAAAKGQHDFYGVRFPDGIFIKMTTAGAKVSIVTD